MPSLFLLRSPLRLHRHSLRLYSTMSAPWHANFPLGKSSPPKISAAELAALTGPGKEYIVVDVRRTDIDEPDAKTMHPAAINLPAQTFYPTVSNTAPLLKNIPKVVFHCNSCKPGGRGPRSAAWYQDYLDENGIKTSEAFILKGGYKAWAAEFPDRVVKL